MKIIFSSEIERERERERERESRINDFLAYNIFKSQI